MSRDSSGIEPEFALRVLQHLAEIGAGRCSITDEELARAPTDLARELLVGVLTLHEDLCYERELREVAEKKNEHYVAELRAAVRARDEFLSVASHELRTPLSTLGLQATGLSLLLAQRSAAGTPPDVKRRIDVIRRQIGRLEKLTGDLLDVTRIASGRLDLHCEPIELGALVEEVVERYSGVAPPGELAIAHHVAAPMVGIWDLSRIDQVLSNLISNALRYGAGNPISVAVSRDDTNAVITVKDQGIGIAAERKDRIFEQFERAVSSENYGGFGLGLWIARMIVEAHDGTIAVESELGRGATFTVTLPLPQDSVPKAP